jgi:hypothetical protein
MGDELQQARDTAAGVLSHPVPHALPAGEGLAIVAASIAGEPPQARVAWVDPETREILARVACPPGRPSRFRPVVATSVTLDEPDMPADHVVVCRVAEDIEAVRVVYAGHEDESPVAPVGAEGLSLARLPVGAPIVSVEALDARGEPVGTLVGEGVTRLRIAGGSVSGRLGLTHGMAAGIGGGYWAGDLDSAAFAAGYTPMLPSWAPEGFERSPPRVEPDVAYPAAPPAIVLLWTGPGDGRVILRQAPAPLASPELPGRGSREVRIGEATGVLRGTRLATLVWETGERAFGIQVLRVADAPEVALRMARSIRSA